MTLTDVIVCCLSGKTVSDVLASVIDMISLHPLQKVNVLLQVYFSCLGSDRGLIHVTVHYGAKCFK